MDFKVAKYSLIQSLRDCPIDRIESVVEDFFNEHFELIGWSSLYTNHFLHETKYMIPEDILEIKKRAAIHELSKHLFKNNTTEYIEEFPYGVKINYEIFALKTGVKNEHITEPS